MDVSGVAGVWQSHVGKAIKLEAEQIHRYTEAHAVLRAESSMEYRRKIDRTAEGAFQAFALEALQGSTRPPPKYSKAHRTGRIGL
jgi:hypothetical protein